MSITETIQAIIGKYSVTGVLRERLELEIRQFEIERAAFIEKISALEIENSKLSTENEYLRTSLKKAKREIEQFRETPKPYTPKRVQVGEDW